MDTARVYQHIVPGDGDCLFTSIGMSMSMPGNEYLTNIFYNIAMYQCNRNPELQKMLNNVDVLSANHIRVFVAWAVLQDTKLAKTYLEQLHNLYKLTLTNYDISKEYSYLQSCFDNTTNSINKEKLCQIMLQPWHWGDDFAIRVIQHYFNVQIIVIDSKGNTINIESRPGAFVCLLLHFANNHYNPLVYDNQTYRTAIVDHDIVDFCIGLYKESL
jgi:hypothetical protein